MASRVNTKFVVILSALIVLAVVAIAGFWALFVRTDPQKLIAEGNVFMQQGHIQAAVDDYQKALKARGNDVKLMLTTADALKKLPVTNVTDAKQVFGKILGLTRQASDLRPNDQKLLDNYYSSQLRYGRLFNDAGFYKQLNQAADAKLHIDPSNKLALRYRGITQVLLLNTSMTDVEQQQAKDDLLKVLKTDPNDAQALYYLARWNLDQAAQIKQSGGLASKQQAYVKIAVELVGQLLKAGHDDMQAKLWAAQIYVDSLVDMKAKAQPLVDQVDAALLKNPTPPQRVLTVMSLVAAMDATSGAKDAQSMTRDLARARKLLDVAMQQDPGNAMYSMALSRLLRAQGDIPAAVAALEKARVSATQGNALAVLLGQRQRVTAGLEEAELLLTSAKAPSGSTTEPSDSLKQVSSVIDDLTAALGADAPKVNLLKGWLALKQGDYQTASTQLSQASTQMADASPLVLRLSAEAFEKTGQWGAARDQLKKCLAIVPTATHARVELAAIYLAHGSPDKAAAQVKAVLAQDPENVPAQLLRASLLSQSGKIKQALAIYQGLDPAKHPTIIPAMADLYVAQGEKAKALGVLRQRFDVAPDDLRTLSKLLSLTPGKAERLALIDHAAKAGVDPQAVAALRMLVSGVKGKTAEERVNAILSTEKDPVKRALAKAQFYLQQGDVKEAATNLAIAAKAAPDNPTVVRLQFQLALKDQNWDMAKQLAAKAGSLNLDQAKGAFFDGDLAMAQHQWDQAVASYERGLSVRPVYSMGQRLLGDALAAQGNDAQSKRAFEQAIDQRPNNVKALRGLAAIADKQGDHASALQYLEQAVAADPRNESLALQYVGYEQRYGDKQQALKYRLQLAKAAPKLAPNLRGLAVLQAQLDQADAAQKTVDALVAADGMTRDNLQVQLTVDAILGKKQDGDKAAQAYIAKLGKKVTARDYLMLAHYRMAIGDGDGMMQAYHQAMAVENPKTQIASRELADLLFSRNLNSAAATIYQRLVKDHPNEDSLKLLLAESLIRQDKLDEAQKIIAPIKSNAGTTSLRALIAEKRGDDNQALALFNQAISNGHATSAVYYERGRLLAKQGNAGDAIHDLNRAIAANPRFLPARQLLVKLALAGGQYDTAEDNLKAMLTINPSLTPIREQLVAVYRRQGDPTSARTVLADAVKRFPKQAVWPLLMGQVLFEQGDHTGALQNWRQAVSLSPTALNLATLGDGLMKLHQADQTVAVLDDHAEQLNKYPLLQGLKAQALAAGGKHTEAVTLFGHALARSQNQHTYQSVVQQMNQSLGVKAALAQLQAADSAGSAHPVWSAIAQASIHMGEKDYSAALARLNAMSTPISQTDQAALDRLKAVCLAQTGEYAKAQQAYERILKASPDDAYTLNNLAYLLVNRLNKPKEAVALAQKAANVEPNSPQVLDTLGWAQFKAGRIDDARQTLEKSVKIHASADNNYHLACVYQSLGVSHRATTLLNQALALAKAAGDTTMMQQAQQSLQSLSPKTSKDR